MNENTFTTGQDIADAFNEHFATIGNKIAAAVQPLPYNPINMMHSNQELFKFSLITPSVVEKIIMNLKSKKGNIGCYTVEVLKHLCGQVSPVLTRLINYSFLNGSFPDFLKIASVTPIYKSGDKTNVCNYRPISILSTISKIFEKVIVYQLNHYFNANDSLSPSQYGFRQGKSTIDALLNTMQYVYDNLDRNRLVLSFFLDFSKAFDCVDHELLITKLDNHGIRGLELNYFKSYLSNREQYVSLQGVKSEKRIITRGVPQGSCLGPLLFLIFINDFPKSKSFFKFTLFADDSTLTCSFPDHDPIFIHETLNLQLIQIDKWLRSNKLQINAEKSNFIVYSYRNSLDLRPVNLGHNIILQARSTKFLGLYLDEHLRFTNHIQHITGKISKTIGILHKLKNIFPKFILKNLYNSLILPYITYGIEVWYAAPDILTSKILILQKKAIRAIHNIGYLAHTNEYFKQDKILKAEEIFKLQVSSKMYAYINSDDNEFRHRYYSFASIHNHHTRNRNNLVIPRYNKTSSQSCFLYQSTNEWSNVPLTIQYAPSIQSFKRRLKLHYCSLY